MSQMTSIRKPLKEEIMNEIIEIVMEKLQDTIKQKVQDELKTSQIKNLRRHRNN
jgi:hypothetical protein